MRRASGRAGRALRLVPLGRGGRGAAASRGRVRSRQSRRQPRRDSTQTSERSRPREPPSRASFKRPVGSAARPVRLLTVSVRESVQCPLLKSAMGMILLLLMSTLLQPGVSYKRGEHPRCGARCQCSGTLCGQPPAAAKLELARGDECWTRINLNTSRCLKDFSVESS